MSSQPPTELVDYQFNIRSFHPNKTFGWSGLFFEGDNRRFSLKPSGTPSVTSRIWQRFTLSTSSGAISNLATRSDPSKAPWQNNDVEYDNKRRRPKGQVIADARTLPSKIRHYELQGRYGGENHAMPGSGELKESLGLTYVPTLNVNYKILIDIDRANRHMDIVTYVRGDGFPNCEAFVVGPGDSRVFLGVHVRKGAAPLALAANLGYPMIASAIRLPINLDGSFSGTVGDELARRSAGKRKLEYQSISEWNARFHSISPNSGRCKGVEDPSHLKELLEMDCYL